MNEQTVTETDGQVKPESEDTDALDSLLSEYEEGTKVEPPKTDRIDEIERRLAQQETAKDMSDIVTTIKGDSDVFDSDMVEGWINAKATKDPRIAQAWTNRHTNPVGFKNVINALKDEFHSKLDSIPNREATETNEQVAAAVQSASSRQPEEKNEDWSKMPDSEFFRKVSEL